MSINRLDDFLDFAESIFAEEENKIINIKRENKKNELSENTEQSQFQQVINDEFMIFKEIRTLVANVDEGTDELNSLTVEAMSSTQDSTGNSAMFERLSRVQNRAIITLKSTLDELMRNAEFKSDETLEGRIQRNLTNFLVTKFAECAQKYQNAVTRHGDVIKEATERRIKIMFPDFGQDSVSGLDSSNNSKQIGIVTHEATTLQEQVLLGIITNERDKGGQKVISLDGVTRFEALHFSCAELNDKLRDVRCLEKGVQELHAMFVDLAAMVEQGQDYTNSIELQIMRAVDYSIDTNVALANAKIVQKRRNKRAMRISGVLIVVIVVATLISVFTAGA